MSTPTAKQEWAAMWPLPLIALLGIMGSSTFGYSSGVFMEAMTKEFGWSRAQFSSAFAVQMVVGLTIMPVVGRIIDRVGPRRVALVGIVIFMASFCAFSLANGERWQWWLLGGMQALGAAMVGPPVWIAAVVPRFHKARGMALAVALAGVGMGTAIWPIVAALYVEAIGWRLSFPALILSWGIFIIPLTLLFFRDPPRSDREIPQAAKTENTAAYRAALRSRDLILVTLAGGIFAAVSYGMTLHIVPILQDRGLTLAMAAGLAGLTGICSIVGRLGTGYLLDHVPTRPLALIIFLLPIGASLLLWQGGGAYVPAVLSVVIIGLAAGAETDIVVYTLSRRFGQAVFASVYSVVIALFALSASLGPLLASVLFDREGSYDTYLAVTIPLVALSALLMWIVLLPKSGQTRSTGAQKPSPI